MLFAWNHNDERIHIDETYSNQEYYCPYCGAPLVTKKGESRAHHFAHKAGHMCTDTWSHSDQSGYDMSAWHNEWQAKFPKENQEIKLSMGSICHRADILVDRTVVEFQNSLLPVKAFDERNNFYTNLGYKVVWLFNMSELYKNGEIKLDTDDGELWFEWENPKKAFRNYDPENGCVELFLQLSEECPGKIIRVKWVSSRGFEYFVAEKFISAEEFLRFVGLADGVCRAPCHDDLEQDEEYKQFAEKYGVCLNKQQERALQAIDGSNLLLAVPGSGKTTVLVARLGYMVLNKHILPERIIAITYNTSAAEEMKKRFSKQFGESYGSRMEFRTINSLSYRIYLDHCERNNIKKRRMIEGKELRRVHSDICRRYGDIKYVTEAEILQLATNITYIKNMMLSEKEIMEMERRHPHLKDMYDAYQSYLEANSRMDFDDQMVFAYNLLKNDPQTHSIWQNRYGYICIDETQDTSKIQHEIIRIMAEGNSVFMVGDEDQSIYGFRAAYPKALLNFKDTYVNPYILRMERNYRSTPQIVQAAQKFISENEGRYYKNMTTEREDGEEVSLEYVESREAQYLKLLDIAKETTSEVAFLYRDNDSAVVLVDLLLRNNIPFKLRKPEKNFFGSAVIQDIKAYLSLAINQYDADALDKILNKGVIFLTDTPRNCAVNNCKWKKISALDAIDEQMKYVKREKRYRENIGVSSTFRRTITKMSSQTSYDAITTILEAGYEEYAESHYVDSGKISILEILAKQEPNIRSFLQRLNELEMLMEIGFENTPNCNVILSTIHSSKGLEYNSVYMVDVFDGRFPASQTDYSYRSKDAANDEQEERRLFYVGITRAKDNLHLFSIKDLPSRFIDDLDLSIAEDVFAEHDGNKDDGLRETKKQKIKTVETVKSLLFENYDQEDYIIVDMLGFQRMKCVSCNGIKIADTISKKVTCNLGICQDCAKH